jgi:hypothetical protein
VFCEGQGGARNAGGGHAAKRIATLIRNMRKINHRAQAIGDPVFLWPGPNQAPNVVNV